VNKQDIIEYCLTFPGTYEDYPFDEVWAVVRHGSNKKGFAFIYERNEKLCVNLKCDPSKADFFRQVYNDVIPGYHMNKLHWNTIITDGDVSEHELYDMIRDSYDLIKPSIRREGVLITKPWPENLYYIIFGEEYKGLPVNAEQNIEYVLDTFKKREKSITLSRYKDMKAFSTIGNELGISSSQANQIGELALRKMRHSKRKGYLMDVAEQLRQEKLVEEAKKNEHLQRITDIRERRKGITLESVCIEELDLNVRSYNVLKRLGINTLADLSKLTVSDLKGIRNIGVMQCKHIVSTCEKYGVIILN